MKKLIYRVKYHWHSYQHGYHKILLKDCISPEIRTKLIRKLEFHEKMASRIYYRLHSSQTIFL